jgi:hypothetical protein
MKNFHLRRFGYCDYTSIEVFLTLLILIYQKVSSQTTEGLVERRRQMRRENALLRQAEQAKEQTDESDLPSPKDIKELAKEEE